MLSLELRPLHLAAVARRRPPNKSETNVKIVAPGVSWVPKCTFEFPFYAKKASKGAVATTSLSILEPTLRPTTPKIIQNHIFIDFGA